MYIIAVGYINKVCWFITAKYSSSKNVEKLFIWYNLVMKLLMKLILLPKHSQLCFIGLTS
jgi:hypothetical protein